MTPAGVDVHFVGHWHQYTRYPPIDSRNGKVVSDFACMSADNKTYTDPKYPTLIVTGAPGDIEVNPDHCQEEWQIQNLCSGNYGEHTTRADARAPTLAARRPDRPAARAPSFPPRRPQATATSRSTTPPSRRGSGTRERERCAPARGVRSGLLFLTATCAAPQSLPPLLLPPGPCR